MNGYARRLFSIAAAFNFIVAGSVIFARDAVFSMLELTPADGTNLVFVYITAAMIACFGYSYVCVAYDARKYRAYISLGVIGKLLVVGIAGWFWLAGVAPVRLPALAGGDLVFAGLFVDYLRRTAG